MKFQEHWLLPQLTIVSILFAFSLVFPVQSLARSGCCSHHGGVCGCGCCDGTGLSDTCAPYYPQCSQPVYVAPIKTITPVVYTPRPTLKVVATIKPTLTPTSTPQPTEIPTRAPQVQGVATSPSPSPAPLTTGDTVGVLAFLAVLIGLLVLVIRKKVIKKIRKLKNEV